MDLLWTERMESTDSKLNQRTAQREAAEKTPPQEQPWDETLVLDITADESPGPQWLFVRRLETAIQEALEADAESSSA